MRMGAQAAYPVPPRISISSSLSPPPATSSSSLLSFVVVIIYLVCSSSLSTYVGAQAPVVNQAEVLRRFKAGLANGGEPGLAEWNTNPLQPCGPNSGQWLGVICFGPDVFGLKLENMGFTGRLNIDALMPLQTLRSVSFTSNKFEGPMPDWKKLGALMSLYLSNNGFSGEIPEDAFKGMTSLKKLYLANNRFTGKIPASLESPKLIELRLDNNQFSGSIPEISSDDLKLLNLSNNQLDGPIPETLQSVNPTSFAGNKGLCGPPLDSTCPFTMLSPTKIALIVASLVGLLILCYLLRCCCHRHAKKQKADLDEPSIQGGVDRNAAAARAVVSEIAALTGAAKKVNSQSAPAPSGQHQGGGAGRLTFVDESRRKFDLQDLMRASAEVLGSGNFGGSYKAILVDGEALVVKRFKQMNSIAKEDFHEHMRRLGRLKHPHLLALVAYLYRKEEKLLVFDYISNASLAKHLHGKHSADQPGLNWATRLKIIKGLAKGLTYLHNELPSLTVPHAHLKSSNVLLDEEFTPLLMDYSLAPVVNSTQLQQVLMAYKSPEYASQCRVCKKTDVWCMGILILEVLTGRYVIAQGRGNHAPDLAGWVEAIVQEVEKDGNQAFDKEMAVGNEKSRAEMERLLQIGIACCEEDVDKRIDLEEAVKQIDQVQEE